MRRLLVLGSDASDDAYLEAAVPALATLGELAILTAVLVSPSATGDGIRYRNLLVRLDSALDTDALHASCKAIEATHGRRPGAVSTPIDIDLLATDHAGLWQVDERAMDKGEIDRDHVRTLLAQARIRLHVPHRPVA